MIASALALLLMQVGPAPTSTTFPDIPDETRERARHTNAENAPSLSSPSRLIAWVWRL